MTDYSGGLNVIAEPGLVKSGLPIAYVLDKVGVQIIPSGERLHALCPFHEDHSPSLDIYPWSRGERWGCWVCGDGGDVIDLMRKLWGLGFREAVAAGIRGISKMKEEKWAGPRVGTLYEWNERAALDLWEQGTEDGIADFLALKGISVGSEWLAGSWAVRSRNGELMIPILNIEGRMVGMKHRPLTGGRRPMALPGSRLRDVLYGEHRWRDDVPVLLVEGESDTWRADWELKDFLVLGVPSGAGTAPCRLDLLRGMEVLVIFDGDEAGRLGAARWVEAIPGARSIPLPEGEDICSYPSPLLHLID